MKKLKKASKDQSEEAVAKYWLTHSADELDWSKAEHWEFPNLKLSTRPITIRLTESLLNKFKIKANQLDVPYQSLMKQALAKGLTLL